MAVDYKDYYKILGVDKKATEKEIRSAYRKLARQHHPDVNPGDKKAEARFREINAAYEVLKDPDKRKKYDKYGDQWEHADQIEEAQRRSSAGDFFRRTQTQNGTSGGDMMLAVTARPSEQFERKGPDLYVDVPVTLTDAVRGGEVRVPTPKGTRLALKIPAGTQNGRAIRLTGQGMPRLGSEG